VQHIGEVRHGRFRIEIKHLYQPVFYRVTKVWVLVLVRAIKFILLPIFYYRNKTRGTDYYLNTLTDDRYQMVVVGHLFTSRMSELGL